MTGFTAWLALAAVLLIQVGAAAHEAQHTPADIGDVCEVCVQLDSSEALDSSVGNSALLLFTPIETPDWTDADVVSVAYRSPQLRAPPALI